MLRIYKTIFSEFTLCLLTLGDSGGGGGREAWTTLDNQIYGRECGASVHLETQRKNVKYIKHKNIKKYIINIIKIMSNLAYVQH